ncbi:MAG: pseudouridine synthase [Candidatus Omnitrophica bacterium]|nr:pseudouridine synthase [Candidatus Omnitrophota bacterium]
MKKRLQVVVAHAGICSRRKAAEIIEGGKVLVNNELVTEKGFSVDPQKDIIEVNGRNIAAEKVKAYYLLNKPKGCVTTVSDDKGRKTVMDYLPRTKFRVYPVGRLDKETEGALILTNDGELANKLMHPNYGITKIYLAEVKKPFDPAQKQRLEKGVILEGKRTIPCKIDVINTKRNSVILKIELHEGKKRQIRRMMERVDCYVISLKRISYGGISLKGLSSGQCRLLAKREVDMLKAACSL